MVSDRFSKKYTACILDKQKFIIIIISASRQGDTTFPRQEDGTLLYDDIDYKVTWTAMEKLVEKGLVRAIGLSNFNSRQIDDVLTVANIKPAVLQVGRYISGFKIELKSSQM